MGAATGTTTVNNALTVAATKTFTAGGASNFNPDDTNDVTFTTDSNSTIVLNGLQTTTGSTLCTDNSNNLVKCDSSGLGLQFAYDNGNTITTTNSRDIGFTLANTTSDSNFTITTAVDSESFTRFARADGADNTFPAQLAGYQ